MIRNIGSMDRTARLVLGAVLALAGVAAFTVVPSLGTAVGAVALLAGLILVVTGVVGMCPIYRVLGMSTADETDTAGRA